MTASRAAVNSRLDKGQSQDCAHSHHDRCHAESCACQCHADPQAFAERSAKNQENARRAWTSRRAGTGPAETAPKRPELKPAAKAAVSAGAARQIKSEFSLVFWAADQGAAKAWPQQWLTPDDRLADDERTALVNATYGELEARFPQLLKFLAKAQESAPEAALIYTVATIAAPRLARHGLISAELASAITFAPLILANLQQQAGEPAEPGAAAVGAEPAPIADRPNGYGEVNPGEPFVAPAHVQTGAPVEAGFSDLRHGSGDQNGARNGRHPL